MFLSSRVKGLAESITLKLNEQANLLAEEGRKIYNLTAGQLPFKPQAEFIHNIETEMNFLKSFQYSPIPGFLDLRKKILESFCLTRGIDFTETPVPLDCVISNGGKHSIYNVLGAIVDPGDEVVIIAPYWISYPEMIKLWGGEVIAVKGESYNAFVPQVDEIKKVLTPRTKAIIINAPNNPTGIHYSKQWMTEFAQLVEQFPNLILISDEIYFDLFYFDPKPSYFYQLNLNLLKRTVIIDGISKSFACTGLRIGYLIGPKMIVDAAAKIQGQTTSGANSLIQRALLAYDTKNLDNFLVPIRNHLRGNAKILCTKFRESGLSNLWYQTTSAFYFMIDFTQAPIFKKYDKQGDSLQSVDYANEICSDLLNLYGVAVVPGSDFGIPNSARMSLVLEEVPFREAVDLLTKFMSAKSI